MHDTRSRYDFVGVAVMAMTLHFLRHWWVLVVRETRRPLASCRRSAQSLFSRLCFLIGRSFVFFPDVPNVLERRFYRDSHASGSATSSWTSGANFPAARSARDTPSKMVRRLARAATQTTGSWAAAPEYVSSSG